MRNLHSRLVRKQKLGTVLFLICCWAVLVGIFWMIFEDIRDGFIISGAGAIGSGVMYLWLGFINSEYQ